MKNFLYLLLLLALISCKEASKNNFKKEIKENKLEKKIDTLFYDFNLTVEHYIRTEQIYITKNKGKQYIQGIVIEKIYGLDSSLKTTKLKKREYNTNNDSINLKYLINKNMFRINKKTDNQYLLKVLNNKDSLKLYSYGLLDRIKFIKNYIKIMKSIYPKEKIYEEINF